MRFYLRNDFRDRPGIYYVCWTDSNGSPRRASCRTRDRDAAEKARARHLLEFDRPKDLRPDEVTLEEILARYHYGRGKSRTAQEPLRYMIKAIGEHFPGITVAEFDNDRQRALLEKLAAKGLRSSTIERRLTALIAALNFAKDAGMIGDVPDILRPEKTQSAGVRPFSIPELRKLFAAARSDLERTLVMLLTGTNVRPGPLLDLTWDRVDFEAGSIDYRVPGRRLNNKRRTVVPMAPTLAKYLEARKSVGFVTAVATDKGTRQRKGYKVPLRRLYKRAGLAGCSAYRIRKAVASYLGQNGVATLEVQAMLGHKYADGETWRYVDPGHMEAARQVIEQLLREVAPPWLSLASNWQVAKRKSLSRMVVGGPAFVTQTAENDDVF